MLQVSHFSQKCGSSLCFHSIFRIDRDICIDTGKNAWPQQCTIAGTVGYIAHRKQKKLDKQFGLALQEYLDAARNGTLNLDILNSLISSIEAIEKTLKKILSTSMFQQLNLVI